MGMPFPLFTLSLSYSSLRVYLFIFPQNIKLNMIVLKETVCIAAGFKQF